MVHAGQTVKRGYLLKLSQNSIQAALKNLDDKVKTLEAGKGSGSQKKVNSQKRAAEQAWAGILMIWLCKAEMFPWIMQGRKFR